MVRALEKPENITQYKKWLQETHKVTIDERYSSYFESVVNTAKMKAETSEFWIKLLRKIPIFHEKYQLKFGYPLFMPQSEPVLLTKSFDSFFLKTCRKNILENSEWPNEPKGGWLLPENWFSKINDILRTLFVVKYFDGVQFTEKKNQIIMQGFKLALRSLL